MRKAVKLEEMCVEFDLNTKEAIEKIKGLEGKGDIQGIFDEWGKYYYISKEELDETL